MSNGRRWTSAEDRILIKAIKKYPDNLRKAFESVANKTGRSKSACAIRWYKYTSKSYSKDVNNACFAVYSANKYAINRKNPTNSILKERKSIWQRIKEWIHLS